MAMNPTSGDHQQKRQQRWHRTHAIILPPAVVPIFGHRGLDKRIYVGTTVWFFFVSNYAKIIPYALVGQLDTTNFITSLLLLPLVPVGVKLGVIIQGKLEERVFYQISYWALLALGIKLVYDGVTLP
jgi:uncharacterized membrane protein YfcA